MCLNDALLDTFPFFHLGISESYFPRQGEAAFQVSSLKAYAKEYPKENLCNEIDNWKHFNLCCLAECPVFIYLNFLVFEVLYFFFRGEQSVGR